MGGSPLTSTARAGAAGAGQSGRCVRLRMPDRRQVRNGRAVVPLYNRPSGVRRALVSRSNDESRMAFGHLNHEKGAVAGRQEWRPRAGLLTPHLCFQNNAGKQRLDLRLLRPTREPAQNISSKTPDKNDPVRRHMDPMSRAFDDTENLTGPRIRAHDAPSKRIQRPCFNVFTVGDEPQLIFRCHEQILRRAQVIPLSEELPFSCENLNAVVLPITDVHIAFRIERHRVRHVKLARGCAGPAPLQ